MPRSRQEYTESGEVVSAKDPQDEQPDPEQVYPQQAQRPMPQRILRKLGGEVAVPGDPAAHLFAAFTFSG